MERLAKALGIENISASQVSEINKGLQEQVGAFRSRPLEEDYPFLWIDALYDKVRVEDRVVSLALMIAPGVNNAGNREILAIEPMFDESEDSWREFFRKLKSRGLRKVCLCISDAHSGIQAAVKKELVGTSWQRCKSISCGTFWPRFLIEKERIQEALERNQAFLIAQVAN